METTQPFTVPVLDLESASAEDLGDALRRSSCVFVTNHGIPDELRRRMLEVSIKFFDLPVSEREKVEWDGSGVWNGWIPNGGSRETEGPAEPGLVEWYMAHKLESFANWPETPAEMASVWGEYYDAMAKLAERIVSMVATCLELPIDELPAWTENHFANLCLNHYPAQLEPPTPGRIRLPPHTDECTITILTARDAPGGLQVWPPGRHEWIPVEFPADAYLVQVGELLDRWTNRQLRASVHRVVNPPKELASTAQRDTVIFFHFPALDTVVKPAETALAATHGRARFGAVTARDHLMQRQQTSAYALPDPR